MMMSRHHRTLNRGTYATEKFEKRTDLGEYGEITKQLKSAGKILFGIIVA